MSKANLDTVRSAHAHRRISGDDRRSQEGIRSEGVSESIDAMVQVLSETAHDIRSPLTTVRESIRLVRDKELGPVTDEQTHFLSAAIDQCECIEQMVGDMMQFQRLRSELPRVRRRWVSVSDIRQKVDETLRPWSLPRDIQLLWDGAEDSSVLVFADPEMLRRLLVNLVVNAIRVTGEGEPVLVRLHASEHGDAMNWSVIDSGAGISLSQMRRIETNEVASKHGEGIGLAICRQLAALHFSTLRLRSRLGSGTEATFHTPVGGPTSVAESWARWRQRPSIAKWAPTRSQTPAISKIQRRVRLDPPLLSIELSHSGAMPRHDEVIAVGTVSLGATTSREAAEQFDEILQNNLRPYDLAYRVDLRRWVWIFDADANDAPMRVQTVSDMAQARPETARLHWSPPTLIPVEQRKLTAKLSDLLVRETLLASSPAAATDANQVRLGTSPIVPSTVASERLDEELRRLSERLHRQTEMLQKHARELRP